MGPRNWELSLKSSNFASKVFFVMSDETEEIDEEIREPEETGATDDGQDAGHSSYHPVTDDNGMIRHQLSGMYQGWFLDYASYVILERAVPHFVDGLKPVQRRILHSMKRLDDGRFNKVANIVGHTMQPLHPVTLRPACPSSLLRHCSIPRLRSGRHRMTAATGSRSHCL